MFLWIQDERDHMQRCWDIHKKQQQLISEIKGDLFTSRHRSKSYPKLPTELSPSSLGKHKFNSCSVPRNLSSQFSQAIRSSSRRHNSPRGVRRRQYESMRSRGKSICDWEFEPYCRNESQMASEYENLALQSKAYRIENKAKIKSLKDRIFLLEKQVQYSTVLSILMKCFAVSSAKRFSCLILGCRCFLLSRRDCLPSASR